MLFWGKREGNKNNKAANQRMQAMFDAMPFCANFWNSNFEHLDCNQAAVKMFDLRDKKEYSEKFFELSPEYQPCGRPSGEKAVSFVKKAFEEGFCRFEWMHQKLNGDPMPCEVTLVRIEFGDDYIVAGYTRDMRKEKKMMSEIAQKNNLLKTVDPAAMPLLDAADNENFEDSIISAMEHVCKFMDVDSVGIWQNEMKNGELHFTLKYRHPGEPYPEKTQTAFPYSAFPGWKDNFLRDECINSQFSGLSPDEQRFFILRDVKSILIIPLFLQDHFWGLFTVDNCRRESLFSGEEIQIFRFTGLMMANAVIRHTQIAVIREMGELAQIMLDAAPYSCILLDRSCSILTCNQAAVNLFKLANKHDFIARFEKLSPEHQPCGKSSKELAHENIEKAFEDGRHRFEWTHQTLDGDLFPAEVSLMRIEYKGEHILAGYIRELREQKAMLAEMQKAEDNLRLARDAAEDASFTKSAFFANMSHEIRTAMSSIMGFSELALDDYVHPDTRDYLGKIQMNTEWLLQIINDILDVSKIESGKMELENIPFDICELFSGCRTLILPKAIEKGIMLYFYAEPSVGSMLLGDPTRLRQVLVNLLSNSVRFTNTGIVKFLAKIKKRHENGITIHFTIRDSGVGMTREQVNKIFNPFIRIESSTTRKCGGTGLGLAITKKIIELMGGVLSVESTPGVGSKFSFELTFDTVKTSGDEMTSPRIIFDEFEKPIFEGEVLVCEDNEMNQQVICEHLARVGLKTAVAENGRAAVEMIKSRMEKPHDKNGGEKQFDLIFMDIHMPVMDGLEASVKISELNIGIPIIASTANIMNNDKRIYRESGMSDCLNKPFTSHELWRCLLKHLTPAKRGSWLLNAQHKNTQTEDSHESAVDIEFQRSLQTLFVRNNKKIHAEIAKALKEDDIKLAHRLVHNIKNNAGHLGKNLLRKAAAEVESSLRNGENMVTPDQMVLLQTELKAALMDFEANFAPLHAEPDAPADESGSRRELPDNASMQELFTKLETMFASGNPDCWKFADTLRLIPGSEELIRQMTELDFDQAVVTLAELKKKINQGKEPANHD